MITFFAPNKFKVVGGFAISIAIYFSIFFVSTVISSKNIKPEYRVVHEGDNKEEIKKLVESGSVAISSRMILVDFEEQTQDYAMLKDNIIQLVVSLACGYLIICTVELYRNRKNG